MPFLPFVLLLAWQALSRSASFALGWATALYFGQVPGREGRALAVVSLVSAGWVIVVIGFGIPLVVGASLEAAGIIERTFDVALVHYAALASAVVGTPPAVAAVVVIAGFQHERSFASWLRLVPVSYPATFLLGLSVLQMVAWTPFLLIQRLRQHRTLVQVPLVMRAGTQDGDLLEGVREALASIDVTDVAAEEATGPTAWPMRTVGFAVRHLLGAVVRGDPVKLKVGDDIEVFAYATNISILGPAEEAHLIRAAVERELAFRDAHITWNEEAQAFEDQLMGVHAESNGDVDAIRERLDGLQDRIDRATLSSEDWNVLYRLRLQIEHRVTRGDR